MDQIDTLLEQYAREGNSRIPNPDFSKKPGIISALGESASDPRVVRFLASVATDEKEYDLARIEALKVFQVEKWNDPQARGRIVKAVRDVLTNCRDVEVRNYAAMAAAEYGDIPEIYIALATILKDGKEESNLRWNTFAAIERLGSSPPSIELLRSLFSDSEFKDPAIRVLRDWKALL